MSRSALAHVLGPVAVFVLFTICTPGFAQHGGGGAHGHGVGPGGMGPGSSPGGPGFANGYGPRDYGHSNGSTPSGSSPESAGAVSGMRGGLQLGPPGRWWDDKHFAKDLKLRPDQQRRMDAIFETNRPTLQNRLTAVQQEETRMEMLVHSKNPDESTLNAEIDRLWQSRAELEKAKTHYLLRIRQEMDTEQLTLLEEHR